MLKPKNVLMQPGVMLEYQDCPETPDPLKQKVYRSFVANVPLNCNVLSVPVTWIRCDIAHPAAQLARFCAPAGASHWAALHHLMGHLNANKSFNPTYHKV